jgi:hypothetical protein
MTHQHIRIAVSDAASPGAEEVPARWIEGDEWQVVRSPLYAMGVAAGDVVRVLDRETGAFEILRRGGRVSVQFYLGPSEADDGRATASAAKEIAAEIEPLGGLMEAFTRGLVVFTVPVAAGFPVIDAVFEAAACRWKDAEWQYTNVYDEATGEPLGWWE